MGGRAKQVLVFGLGASGRAALALLDRLGVATLASDDSALAKADRAELPRSTALIAPAAVAGRLREIDFVVTSPGVPASHPLLVAALDRGIPVKSELELAAEHIDAPILAITGTNGKSTTVTLVGRMLEAAGRHVFVGGNLGRPLSEAVGTSYDACVVEVSSFQLEWVDVFRPAVGCVLNVTADHIDRHGSLEAYEQTKMRLFARMDASDWAVLAEDQPWWRAYRSGLRAGIASFGPAPLATGDGPVTVYDRAGRSLLTDAGETIALDVDWPTAPHDFENAAAAAEIARRAGVDSAAIARGLAGFRPLAHRLQRVAVLGGVEFWNDSKATNVGAACRSIEAFDQPVILLAGGVAKGASFEALAGHAGRLKLVVAYGQARECIAEALAGCVAVERAPGMADALAAARAAAAAGDVVLLAPACASFDEFTDYADRGRRFVELVTR